MTTVEETPARYTRLTPCFPEINRGRLTPRSDETIVRLTRPVVIVSRHVIAQNDVESERCGSKRRREASS